MMQRILLDLALLSALLVLPFWYGAAVAMIGIVCIPRYVEALCYALVLDLLFRVPFAGEYASTAIMVPLSCYVVAALIMRELATRYIRKRAL